MEKKYWVPAIERANLVLNLIAEKPGQLRLIDLSNALNINKSSMYSLLHTLETLEWIVKNKGDTYSLGISIGSLSSAYFKQFNLVQSFYVEAVKSVLKIGETIQLAILDGNKIFYLGKEEGNSRVRIATDTGMHYPAHASAIGKALLSQYNYEELKQLYPDGELESRTVNTVTSIDNLWSQLEKTRENGFSTEYEEGTLDFCCVGAPIRNFDNKIIAAVSFAMLTKRWNSIEEDATKEILDLAKRLSEQAGKSYL